MNKNLESLLQQKRRDFEEDVRGFESNRNAWLQKIDELYQQIERWLAPYVEKNYLHISHQSLDITEEAYGNYQTQSLIIAFFNGRTIIIRPKGLGIVAAKGRVDVQLETRTIKLIVDPETDEWQIAEQIGRGVNKRPLNRDGFEQIIEEFVADF